MNWYKSDMVAWKEIIETVAAEEHRIIVEKMESMSILFLEGVSRP